MKSISLIVILLGMIFPKSSSAAQIFVPDYPGQFHKLEFSHGPYQIELTLFFSEAISWVDFARIEVNNPGAPYSVVRNTRFINGVYSFKDRNKQRIAIDLKDGLTIEVAKDFSELNILRSRKPPVPLEFTLTSKDAYPYHVRFPTETEHSPLFVVGMTQPVHRQPRRGFGWYPGELKLYLMERGLLSSKCETLLKLLPSR